MSLFEQLNQQNQQADINEFIANFKKNPFEFLIQQRFKIPQNLAQNPQGIVQHLLSSGQISQQQLAQAQQMMSQMRR